MFDLAKWILLHQEHKKDEYGEFFAGEIVLQKTVCVENTDCKMVLKNALPLLEVKVNGKYAGKITFDKELDLSGVLHRGENKFEFILTVSNRNLLGPFHAQDEHWIGVHIFERSGMWKDGKCDFMEDKYFFKSLDLI